MSDPTSPASSKVKPIQPGFITRTLLCDKDGNVYRIIPWLNQRWEKAGIVEKVIAVTGTWIVVISGGALVIGLITGKTTKISGFDDLLMPHNGASHLGGLGNKGVVKLTELAEEGNDQIEKAASGEEVNVTANKGKGKGK